MEMMSPILGFFINGLYQLFVLYFMGWVIPIGNPTLVLSRGYGIRNAVSLLGIRGVLDNLIPFYFQLPFFSGTVKVPVATLLLIVAFCVFIVWFRRTKLGQDMRAIGQNMAVANSAGIADMPSSTNPKTLHYKSSDKKIAIVSSKSLICG